VSFWGACDEESAMPNAHFPHPVILRSLWRRISAPQCTNPNLSSLPLSVILNPKTLWQCYNSQIALYLLFVVIRGEESPHLKAPLPSLSFFPPILSFWGTKWRRISAPQCTITPTFADSSVLSHFSIIFPYHVLSLRMTWPVHPPLSVILRSLRRRICDNQCAPVMSFWGACPDPSGKNLRTPMHKPQPIILTPICHSEPQDSMTVL
jgi:hypothetical protein